MKRKIFSAALLAGLLALLAGAWTAVRSQEKKETKPDVEMTIVDVEYEGVKVWIPSTLVFKRGQRVRLKLISNIPSEPNQHGFSVDELGLQAVVTRGRPETVEFTAGKAGIFRLYCQLHPAHVAGQVVVLK